MYKFMGYYIIRIWWQHNYAYAALTFKYGIPRLLCMDDDILYGSKPRHSCILFPRRKVLTRYIDTVFTQILVTCRYNDATAVVLQTEADIATRLLLIDESHSVDKSLDDAQTKTDIAVLLNKKVTHNP